VREKNLRFKKRTVRMYWNIPRVVFTYVTARIFYDILIAIWKGPGRFLLCIIVGALIVSLL
jgi:hypothetical protein